MCCGPKTIRLPAPLYADPSTVASMRSDSVISRTLEAGRRADVMIFGVGAVSTSTTLFEGSFLDTRMLDELMSLGAVGEIGGRFFDADGVPVDTELQQRAVSVPLEDIQACQKTILISSGAAKHHATLGALRGKLARLLVCDIDCARWLVGAAIKGGEGEIVTKNSAPVGVVCRRVQGWCSPPAVRARAAWAHRTNEVTIALVSNSQMTDAQKLSTEFEKENPGTKLKFITLSENQARAKITMSTAMGGSEFDVVMISNFETPQWAKDGWLLNLSDYAKNTPGYDENDFIPSLRESLSYEGNMYSVPFYGESSFLMYRKDLFEQAGIKVDQDPNYQPTWQEVAEWAREASRPRRPARASACAASRAGARCSHRWTP